MQNTLLSLVEALDETRKDVLARLEAMSQTQRYDRPTPDAWSPLDTAAHLVRTEQTLFSGLPAPETLMPIRPTFRQWISRCFLTLALAWRIPVPTKLDATRPAESAELEPLAVQWGQHMTWLRHVVSSLPAHSLDLVSLNHPTLGPLTLFQALRLAVAHANFHLPSLS